MPCTFEREISKEHPVIFTMVNRQIIPLLNMAATAIDIPLRPSFFSYLVTQQIYI